MACKHLTKTLYRKPAETGDSALPALIEMPACALRRQPDIIIGGTGRCKETPEQGPCWRWEEEHPGVPDPSF
jgi:hypothetical protein